MYENVCYAKNYVSEVVCRLDFAASIVPLKQSMPKPIYDVVKKFFPIAEPQDIIGTELAINPMGEPTVNQVVNKQWTFWSRDRKNRCTIGSEAVVFSYRLYDQFEQLYRAVTEIITVVMKEYPENQGKRLGLRYINSIPIKDHSDWIENKFYGALVAHKTNQTTKLVTSLEYAVQESDINVRLVYGFSNPDYPSTIKREEFVIDTDAYSAGIIYVEDILKYIEDMHTEVQKSFEGMITDTFRDELNGRND